MSCQPLRMRMLARVPLLGGQERMWHCLLMHMQKRVVLWWCAVLPVFCLGRFYAQVERAVETEINTGPARPPQAGSAADAGDGQAAAAEATAMQVRHNVNSGVKVTNIGSCRCMGAGVTCSSRWPAAVGAVYSHHTLLRTTFSQLNILLFPVDLPAASRSDHHQQQQQ